MKPLVSIVIPTRARPMRLQKTILNILATAADSKRIHFVLKIDDDDVETLNMWGPQASSRLTIVTSPRGNGYSEMGRFVAEAAHHATGKWSWLIDDDAWIEGNGWDEQLASVPIGKTIAQCEFYHLGCSRYGSGSCGPVGIAVPTETMQAMDPRRPVADEALLDMTVRKGWTVHLLRGITYRHDRDCDDQLTQHRKL